MKQSTETYTRRENARRAGVAAGVPSERVAITVCQSARNFDHLSALNFDQVSGGYCGA